MVKVTHVGVRCRVSQRPYSPANAVFRSFRLEPLPLVIHEITEIPVPGVVRVIEEREVDTGQPVHFVHVLHFVLQHHREQQCPRVVIGTVPVVAIGHVKTRMLQDARVIGQRVQVIQLDGGDRVPGIARLAIHLDSPSVYFLDHLIQQVVILLPDIRPIARFCQGIRVAADGFSFPLVIQQLDDPVAQLRGVHEIEKHSPVVGQHLLGIPERGRYNRLGGSHGVDKGARRYLLLPQVRDHVDITHPEVTEKLLVAHEAVDEQHVFLQVQLVDQAKQRVAVIFPFMFYHVRMGSSQHDIYHVGVFLHHLRQGVNHHLD